MKTIKGAFDQVYEKDRESIMELVSQYHYRNIADPPNHDGSLGTVRITAKQFNDCLATLLIEGRESCEEEK